MRGPAVELAGAVKRYGPATVGPLSLSVAAGERVALLGPSGSGKTTVLRLLLGLVAPDAGEARVLGERAGPERDDLRRRAGYVVQGGGLFPHLTAGENAALVARFAGWDPGRIAARLAELGELARLPAQAFARYPRQLSGGQAQRVGLVRALFLDPELLLLDEPLGALDPLTRAELQEDLAEAARALGKTVVVVTHDLAEAVRLADRLVLLRDGRVAADGPLAALAQDRDPFVAGFLRAQRALHLPEGA